MWSRLRGLAEAWSRRIRREREFQQQSKRLQWELENEINPLPTEEARRRAEILLPDRSKFACEPGNPVGNVRLEPLAPLLKELFQRYDSMRDIIGGTSLERSEIGPSEIDPQLIKIGVAWDTDEMQPSAKPAEEIVYLLAVANEDIPPATFTTAYHFLVYLDRMNGLVDALDESS